MNKSKDLTGFVNGDITVIGKTRKEKTEELNKNIKNKKIYWDCKCSCGNIFQSTSSNVKKTKSCGCKRVKVFNNTEKEIGKSYGNLIIVSFNKERTQQELNNGHHYGAFYDCKCKCGNPKLTTVSLNSLKIGHIKSCGCSKFNNPLRIKDLTNKKFGRLTVISRDLERDKEEFINKDKARTNVHWLCKCDCGNPNLKSVTGWQLESGNTQSCGCYASEQIAKKNIRDCTKCNKVEFKDNIAILYDDNGCSCTIDKVDYEYVKDWFCRKTTDKNRTMNYWITNPKIDNPNANIRLHQVIAKNKFGEYDKKEYMPDHLDRNPDNNTRANLYLKTNIENTHNRGLSRSNKSGKTGVRWDENKGRYQAYICVNYKNIHLGYFDNFEEAVQVRKEAEAQYGFTCDDVTCDYDNSTTNNYKI